MLRLVLGLLVTCVLLYGAYRGLRPGTPIPAAQQAAARREGVTLPDASTSGARAIMDEARKIEATQRAGMERAVNAAEGR